MLLRVLRRLRGSTALKSAARVGLLARGVLYLLLAVLAGTLPWRGAGGAQANANGALGTVGQGFLGTVLLWAATVGFAAFGVLRLAAARTDDREGRLRRLSTAGQALVYLALAATTLEYLLGSRSTGSEQSQHRLAGRVLDLPGGRFLLAAAGLAAVAVSCWQLIVAVKGHFADTLHTEQMSGRMRRLTRLVARAGIPARALAVLPVGVLLVDAGLRSDPAQARGLDALLLQLSSSPFGRVVVALAAVGFAVFAAYSFLEARYRQVSAGA